MVGFCLSRSNAVHESIEAIVPIFSLKMLIFSLLILSYIFVGCELRKAKSLVDLGRVKLFTVSQLHLLHVLL